METRVNGTMVSTGSRLDGWTDSAMTARLTTTGVSASLASEPVLRQGARGPAVVRMQKLLAKAGFSPGAADGAFGPATRRALTRFQKAAKLGADGICGKKTWAALESSFDPAPAPKDQALRDRILALARSQLGMHEATNQNDGEILKYPHAFGRGSESWCADFVSWVSTRSGKPLNYAYTPYLLNHLKAAGQWKGKHDPVPGDIILFDINHDGRADHTGFVESVNPDGSVNTIEGNTLNEATGVEGVWRRQRALDVIIGFGRPA